MLQCKLKFFAEIPHFLSTSYVFPGISEFIFLYYFDEIATVVISGLHLQDEFHQALHVQSLPHLDLPKPKHLGNGAKLSVFIILVQNYLIMYLKYAQMKNKKKLSFSIYFLGLFASLKYTYKK